MGRLLTGLVALAARLTVGTARRAEWPLDRSQAVRTNRCVRAFKEGREGYCTLEFLRGPPGAAGRCHNKDAGEECVQAPQEGVKV